MRRKHKRLRKRELRKRRIIVIVSMFATTFLLASGYAAFSTSLNINAKGNLKQNPITMNKLRQSAVTSGDGLYQDSIETDRYIYKGSSPKNYIKFNGNELWRIYSIENDGSIKIVKNNVTTYKIFDSSYNLSDVSPSNSVIGTRYSSSNTDFCYQNSGEENNYKGCNAWGSKYTTLDKNGNHISSQSKISGNTSQTYTLPESNSYLNVYLNHQFNNEKYKGLNNTKTDYENIELTNYYNIDSSYIAYIKNATWPIGIMNFSSNSLSNMVINEKMYQWNGKIGLLTASEYLRAHTNENYCTPLSNLATNYQTCGTYNYLSQINYDWWLISPSENHTRLILYVNTENKINNHDAGATRYIRPALYLCPGITLLGKGTETNPYTINGNCSL